MYLPTHPQEKKKISSLKNLKPPPSGRNINICVQVKKNVITIIGVPAKKFQGGGADQKYPPQHTEKMASTWREKTVHIEKYAP